MCVESTIQELARSNGEWIHNCHMKNTLWWMCKNHNDFSFAFPLNVLKPFFLTNESLKGLRPATGLTNSRITHHQNATHNKILSPPLPLTQKSFNLSAATIWNPQLLVRTEVGYPELAVVQFAAQLIVGLDLAARRGLQNRELRPVRGGNDGVKTVIDCEVILLFSFFALCRHTTGCLVAGMWTMRSLRSSASRIICLWKGKRRCWRRWRALDIRLGKWKRREERCGTDAKYVCEIWTSTIFFLIIQRRSL